MSQEMKALIAEAKKKRAETGDRDVVSQLIAVIESESQQTFLRSSK